MFLSFLGTEKKNKKIKGGGTVMSMSCRVMSWTALESRRARFQKGKQLSCHVMSCQVMNLSSGQRRTSLQVGRCLENKQPILRPIQYRPLLLPLPPPSPFLSPQKRSELLPNVQAPRLSAVTSVHQALTSAPANQSPWQHEA